MQNLANMVRDNYSYVRLLLYNVYICFYSDVVQNSILYNEAYSILYTPCHVVFSILLANTML